MTELAGSVAVVTGAGSGIGRALTLAFAAAGSPVVAADVDVTRLAETESLVAAAVDGAPLLALPLDVRDPQAVEALAAGTVERFGSADIVCSNAGVMRPGAVWEQPAGTWDRVIGVNLMGAVNLANAFVPRMIAA